MPWVALYRDLQKLTDKRKNTCKKLECHIFKGWRIHLEKSRCQKEKCIILSVKKKKKAKKKKVSGCQKENIALDLRKKMAYRPAKVHVSSKKKTAALDLDERQSRHHNRDTCSFTNVKHCQNGYSQSRPRWQQVQQCLRTSLSDLRKIQISSYKTKSTKIF